MKRLTSVLAAVLAVGLNVGTAQAESLMFEYYATLSPRGYV